MEWLAQHFYQILVLLLGLLLLARILTSIMPARPQRQRRETRSMPLFRVRKRREGSRVIRVIGVGGGGGNAVDLMTRARTRGIDIIACNTDSQALSRSIATHRIQIGSGITHGRGAGGDPSLGEKAAEADAKKIGRALAGSDIVFITAGLGGGTGSGASPVIARIARDLGALTIAVVTKPFSFEGPARRQVADIAAASLEANADTLVTIPNDRVRTIVPSGSTIVEAFRTVDEVLHEGVQAIVDIIARAGIVNLDFADVRAIMHDAGPALVGVGRASGEDRALLAARAAISSPLLETEIAGARRILFNVLGSAGLRLDEVTAAAEEIRKAADPGATVIFGAGLDKKLRDSVQITVIATGFDLSGEPASSGPSAPGVPTSRIDDAPSSPYVGLLERRAPVDLEAPSYIRRGRRAGDAPLETATGHDDSTARATADQAGGEATGGAASEPASGRATPTGERQRKK
ncbi:MAG TPA: cell division protein FtsZ [Candidatus Limnocylindrales bacterium]